MKAFIFGHDWGSISTLQMSPPPGSLLWFSQAMDSAFFWVPSSRLLCPIVSYCLCDVTMSLLDFELLRVETILLIPRSLGLGPGTE